MICLFGCWWVSCCIRLSLVFIVYVDFVGVVLRVLMIFLVELMWLVMEMILLWYFGCMSIWMLGMCLCMLCIDFRLNWLCIE